MIEIGLNIDEPAWEDYPFVSEDFFHNRLSLFFEHMIGAKLVDTPSKPVEISITLTNDAHIRILNNDYRKKNKPTNILSFPMDDIHVDYAESPQETIMLGDLILAFETIKEEALAQEKSMEEHFTHLLVHGTLHLLGYDHIEDKQAREMEELEVAILKKFDILNPYQS